MARKEIATGTTPLGFEIKTCGRCGGSGQHSYCQSYGTTCFGCAGSGKVYTKKGKAAFLAYEESLKVPVESLQVGDTIKVEAITQGGTLYRYFAQITEIKEDHRTYSLQVPPLVALEVTTEHKKRGRAGMICPPGYMVRKAWSAEHKAEMAAKAIAEHQIPKRKAKA